VREERKEPGEGETVPLPAQNTHAQNNNNTAPSKKKKRRHAIVKRRKIIAL
jgi:hypothetical protein